MDYETPTNLLDVVDLIYEVVSREDALPRMLARVATCFRCPSAALVYVDMSRPAADVEIGFGRFDAAAQKRYAAKFASIDPAPAAMARLPLGEAAATDRLFTPQERADSQFLKEFYHPLGLREALGARITAQDGRFGVVAVQRGPERPPFDEDEIVAFSTLAKHIARAVDLRRRFFAMEETIARFERVFDDAQAGVLLLDQTGTLEQANATARAILARGDALVAHRSGQIGAADADAARRLRTVFSAPDRKPELLVTRGRDGAPIVLRATPIPVDEGGGWRLRVSDLAPRPRDEAASAHVLERALNLTPSSARLTLHLLGGGDLASYAQAHRVSPHTARFHLKSAFKSAEVHRQAELVRLASDLLRDLGL